MQNYKSYLTGGLVSLALGAFYVSFIYKQNTPTQAFLFPFAIMAILGGIGLFIFSILLLAFTKVKHGKSKNTAN